VPLPNTSGCLFLLGSFFFLLLHAFEVLDATFVRGERRFRWSIESSLRRMFAGGVEMSWLRNSFVLPLGLHVVQLAVSWRSSARSPLSRMRHIGQKGNTTPIFFSIFYSSHASFFPSSSFHCHHSHIRRARRHCKRILHSIHCFTLFWICARMDPTCPCPPSCLFLRLFPGRPSFLL
jgi:hypothetical protein